MKSTYFEKVYLGKKNEKVSVPQNKRLQKLLSAKAFNRSGDSVHASMKIFRPGKKKDQDFQPDLSLFLDKFE